AGRSSRSSASRTARRARSRFEPTTARSARSSASTRRASASTCATAGSSRSSCGVSSASLTAEHRGAARRLRTHPQNLIRVMPAKGATDLHDAPNWGIEPVPDRLRVLGLLDTFLLWLNLGISLLVLVAAAYFGLSLKQALLATLVGGLIGCTMLAL